MMTVRLFVGCAANNEDAESCAVLEYTVRKHASVLVEIEWMRLTRDQTSFWHSDHSAGWITDTWTTPFTAFRWGIPEFCGYQGRAIYCDSDVIWQADIAELWGMDLQAPQAIAAKTLDKYCVMLIDCARFRPVGDPRRSGSHQRVVTWLNQHPELVKIFPPDQNWNCIDGEDKELHDPRVKVLHYSNMATQPHLKYALPRLRNVGRDHWYEGKRAVHPRADLGVLFHRRLQEANAAGYTEDKYEPAALFGGYRKAQTRSYSGRQWRPLRQRVGKQL